MKLTAAIQRWLHHLSRGGYIRHDAMGYVSDHAVLITDRLVDKLIRGGYIEMIAGRAFLTPLGVECVPVEFLNEKQVAMLRAIERGETTEHNLTRLALRNKQLIGIDGRLTQRAVATLAAYDKGLV